MASFDLSWQDTMTEMESAMTRSFAVEEWDWDRATVRQNGDTVTTPRNIDDLEQLSRSQYTAKVSPSETEIGWTAGHATHVYNGARRIDGTMMTPRPWTTLAIAGDANAPIEYQRSNALLNVPKYFKDRMIAHLQDVQ